MVPGLLQDLAQNLSHETVSARNEDALHVLSFLNFLGAAGEFSRPG